MSRRERGAAPRVRERTTEVQIVRSCLIDTSSVLKMTVSVPRIGYG
jgi:hypothetical protein